MTSADRLVALGLAGEMEHCHIQHALDTWEGEGGATAPHPSETHGDDATGFPYQPGGQDSENYMRSLEEWGC